jgi:hypothetical protein
MARTAWPASPRQIRLIADLSAERGLDFNPTVPLTGREASAKIDSLFAIPRPRPAAAGPKVPAARYVVVVNGEEIFLQVDRPAKGKWAGHTFVSRLYGSPGDFRKSPLRNGAGQQAREAIAAATYRDGQRDLAGPEAAAVRFSRLFTCCAACLAPLTDEASRERGLGPVCATRF